MLTMTIELAWNGVENRVFYNMVLMNSKSSANLTNANMAN